METFEQDISISNSCMYTKNKLALVRLDGRLSLKIATCKQKVCEGFLLFGGISEVCKNIRQLRMLPTLTSHCPRPLEWSRHLFLPLPAGTPSGPAEILTFPGHKLS